MGGITCLPTVHKVLIHGEKILEHFILPIGKFSEKVQQALNKVFRHSREFIARKMSRTATNEDIRNNLISSDPRISTLRSHLSPFQNSMANVLFPEAQISLLIANTPTEDEPDP